MTATTMDGPLEQRLASLIVDVPDYPQAGVTFYDITPLLGDATAFREAVDALADRTKGLGFDKIVGMEARGFVLAAPVAYRADVGFVPVRKPGKLPRTSHQVEYDLEYGSTALEVHADAFAPGERVLIIDDVLATGGTVAATAELVRRCGAVTVGVAVLMELAFLQGREHVAAAEPGIDIVSLLTVS
jgi:adenine phosphoribosyltransferase